MGNLWDWHIPSGKVIFSKKWCNSLGYEQDELEPHVDTWQKMVHPEDMPKVWQQLEPHLKGETELYECTNRLLTKSGVYRMNLDRGKVIQRDPQGEPIRMVGHDLEIAA